MRSDLATWWMTSPQVDEAFAWLLVLGALGVLLGVVWVTLTLLGPRVTDWLSRQVWR